MSEGGGRQGAGGSLGPVRRQRAGLRRAIEQAERALAAPLTGRPGGWSAEVDHCLQQLAHAVDRHVQVTEGAAGLFEQIRAAAPRLAGPVQLLGEEHRAIRAALEAAVEAHRAAAVDEQRLAEVREQLTALLALLMRHRQRGADLVYQAYDVDIGGE